jgi:GNAT superfamily N-acetyltransferase
MEIRNPDKTHLPQVMALINGCFPGRWTPDEVAGRVFFDQDYDPNHVWMARENGQVLGFLHCVQRRSEGWIKLLVVDPQARRRGIARDLLSRAEFRLGGEGVKELRVESTPPLEFLPGPEPGSPAEALFRSCAYRPGETDQADYLPVLRRPAPEPMTEPLRRQALEFARAHCGDHFGWAEEALACRPAQAVFHPGAGLCLATPGESLGPLWKLGEVAPERMRGLAGEAWALAGRIPPRHPLGLRLWRVPGSGPLPAGLIQSQDYVPFSKALS